MSGIFRNVLPHFYNWFMVHILCMCVQNQIWTESGSIGWKGTCDGIWKWVCNLTALADLALTCTTHSYSSPDEKYKINQACKWKREVGKRGNVFLGNINKACFPCLLHNVTCKSERLNINFSKKFSFKFSRIFPEKTRERKVGEPMQILLDPFDCPPFSRKAAFWK